MRDEEDKRRESWEEYFVQKHLSVKVFQHVWSQLGIFSRQRLLKEHPVNVGEACFSYQKTGAEAATATL